MWRIIIIVMLIDFSFSQTVIGQIGNDLLVSCSYKGAYEYKWQKSGPGGWYNLFDVTKYPNTKTAQLTIRSFTESDAGYYICMARYNNDWLTSDFIKVVKENGQWTQWSGYGDCSVTCGGPGTQTRWRSCTAIDQSDGQVYCVGRDAETNNCYQLACPVNGNWALWSDWGACSPTCGSGSQMRQRTCTNPAPANGGNYCVGQPTDTIQCNLLQCPAIPSIYVSKPSYSVAVGLSVTLECIISSSYPAVYSLWWTKDSIVLNSDRYSSGNAGNPPLTIRSVLTSDAGLYYCHATNDVGTVTRQTTLMVGMTPSVHIPKEYYISKVSDAARLECEVGNKAGTSVSWYTETKTFWTKRSIGANDDVSLLIPEVKLTDRGTYTCYAENAYGIDRNTTFLKVVYSYANKLEYVEKANDTVVLQCVVQDFDTIKWLHNDVPLQTDSEHRYSGGGANIQSLTIVNITRTDKGVYVCQSSLGNVVARSDNIILRVKDIPYVEFKSNSYDIDSGSDVTLVCSYDSYPLPDDVYWEKNGKRLSMSDGNYNGSSAEEPSLTIYSVDKNDRGIYACFVSNTLGVGQGEMINLGIKEPERLSSESAAIGGAVGGILAVIIIVAIIGIIIVKRRKSSPAKRPKRKVNKKLLRAETSINKQENGNQRSDMYVNIAQPGRFSSTDTDGDLPSDEPMANGNQNTENDYYNADELTTVKVDDLKSYIDRKDVSDGLKTQYKSIPYGAEHPTTKAQTKDNMPKNRFKTTFPYDHSRVILEPEAGGGGSDYINANFIDGFEKERCYIASQGPLKHTISDHWRMVWQNNVRRIIMLTNCEEGGKAKCDRYWPVGAKPLVAGNLVLTLLTEKKRAAYVTRDISLENKKTKEKRHVLQYHFTAWPDHGTPDPLYLVLFHKHVKADQSLVESGPELVHCSAGIGRTGTYIALDALMEEGRETGYIDIVKFVKKIRYCRMNMVQTADQYECLHHALLEELTMKDTSIRKEHFNNIWREIESDTRPLNLQRLYEEYKMLEEHKSEHKKAAYLSALSTENKEKNRNQQVVPKDDCRLYLVSFAKGRSDYINAVQAPSYTNFVGYLSTQLPLPYTKVDFWTMIKDHHSSTIVLILNDSSEADMVYTESHDSFTCGLFTGNITNRQPGEQGVTEVTMIMTKKDEKPREILLYQAVCSPIPDKRVLCRLADVLSTRISMTNDPVTIVSSDCAKNCGLFCAFMNAVSSMKIDEYADIFQIVRLLQLRRPEFFSEFQEYRMCYEALNFYLESSNVYANF